jgi:hypothetical protein
MPFAIDTSQRRYFHEENWIEFEEALSGQEIARLQTLWAARVGQVSLAQSIYEKGRDWRLTDTRLEKGASAPLSELAAGLWNERPMYLAFDQVLTPKASFWPFLGKTASNKVIPALFSVESALGAIAVCLSPAPAPFIKKSDQPAEEEGTKIGSAIALKAGDKAVFEKLDPRQTWWIFVYGTDQMRYNPKDTDPFKEYFRVKGAAALGKLTQAKISPIAR